MLKHNNIIEYIEYNEQAICKLKTGKHIYASMLVEKYIPNGNLAQWITINTIQNEAVVQHFFK